MNYMSMKYEDLLNLEAEKRKELENVNQQIQYYEHKARLIARLQDLDTSLEQEKNRLHEFQAAERNTSIQNDTRPFFTLTLLYFINSGPFEPIHRYRFSGSYIGAYLGKQDSSSSFLGTDEHGNEVHINSLKPMTEHYPLWDSLQQDWGDVFRAYDWTEEKHGALKDLLTYMVQGAARYGGEWYLKNPHGLNGITRGVCEMKCNTASAAAAQSNDVQRTWQRVLHALRIQ
jgi:hypothetical protein